jgi:D-alanine-D-alanine ligase
MKVTVLIGGSSAEREVSLVTGAAIEGALQKLSHETSRVDPSEDDWKSRLAELSPDLVFIALHGGAGEDGRIQAELEAMGLAYTGSDPASSELAMDKQASKDRAKSLGILTPESRLFRLDNTERASPATVMELADIIENSIGYPMVAKPNREGSSVGLALLHNREDTSLRLPRVIQASADILVERFIPGRELTVAILGDRALPAIEILPESGLYDFEHKYSKGVTRYQCPAELPGDMREVMESQALAIFQNLGCRDLGRVDFRGDEEGRLWFLEVNTIPGMTETSLVPMSAAAIGLDFPALVAKIARHTLERKA